MHPTSPLSDAAAGEIREFHNWAGRGAADLILPEIEEISDDNDEDTDDDDGGGEDGAQEKPLVAEEQPT